MCCNLLRNWSFTAGLACVVGLGVSLGLSSRALAQPANDACAGAIPLVSGVPAVGDNATATSTNDGAASTCQSNVKNGVWYSLTTGAADAGSWRISSCATPTTHDTVLSIFQAGVDCSGVTTASNILACNDDNGPGCTGTRASMDVTLAASSTYLIRLQTWGGGVSGPFTIVAGPIAATGVCCNNTTGVCTLLFSGTCATGTTAGTGTTCTPTTCAAIAVCCNNATGVCTQIFGGTCGTGTTTGTGTTCTPTPCAAIAACCNNVSGLCTTIFGGTCPTGTTQTGTGTTCTPSPCAPSQACCSGPACTVTLISVGCGTGTGQGQGTTCTPNSCFAADECSTTTQVAALGTQTGTNTNSTTSFTIQPGTLCPGIVNPSSGGFNDVFWSFTAPATTTYTLDTCGAVGFDTILSVHSACPASAANVLACNDDSSAPTGNVACSESTLRSRIQSVALTAGQTYFLRVASYSATTFGNYTLNIAYTDAGGVGACCTGSSCSLTDSAGCTGSFTPGGTCASNPCGPSLGVCCRGATCSTAITAAAACTASLVPGQTAGANFVLAASSCNPGPVSNAPCCFADYNKTGGITVQDIFDFLSDWFAGSPYANTGGNGTSTALSVQNIFDFLNDWFAGGC